MLTRDSILWTIGMLAAVVVALATLGNGITDYGIPLSAVPYLRLLALLIGVVSGKLATSPLPGKDDPPAGSVSPSKFPPAAMIVFALALGAMAVAVTSCGGKLPPSTSPAALSAVKATEVVHALDAARDIAQVVAKDYPSVVSPADFQKVLTAHEAIVKVIGAVPSGWKATAEAGLDQLQKDLSPSAAARLAPYLALVRTLVDAYVPAGA